MTLFDFISKLSTALILRACISLERHCRQKSAELLTLDNGVTQVALEISKQQND
jgi:hypothetical protein